MSQIPLSIIIPAHNEEGRIERTLRDYLNTWKNDAEIIVIPNGCKDGTVEVVKKIQREFPELIYKNFPESILKGGAILEGFKLAKGDVMGYVDADAATSAVEFKRLVGLLNENDGVIASRRMPGAKILTPQPFFRRFVGKVFNILVRMLFLFSYHDTQCGAKIFRKKVIEKITPDIQTKDWAFDIDLLYQAKKHGFLIREIPTVWADQEDSKLDVKRVAPQMLLSALKLRLRYSPLKILLQ